jgi:predicted GIY-YIG superfamily endonuclease
VSISIEKSSCPDLPIATTSPSSSIKLVYYEAGYDASGAIAREKQIKAGSRPKKLDLVNRINPQWRDLYEDL